jgi:hypothetical protein
VTGEQAVVLRNVSDQFITGATVMLRAGFGPKSGAGSGQRAGRLAPGEQTRIAWKSGRSRGTSGSGSAGASIVAIVEEVTTDSCTYRPSQSWPTRGSGTMP